MRRITTSVIFVAACIAAVAASAAAAAETAGYRLAGIIDLGERKLAMLELPDHRQVTVEAGDVVGEAAVAVVEHRSLTLEIDGERIVLSLAGAAASADATTAAALQVVARTVSAATLDRLRELRSAPQATEQEMLAALNETLGLPILTQPSPADAGNARAPAMSARRLLDHLHGRLAQGQPVKLYLEGSSADEIYLLPESSGS
jgi:hypothetical protein